MIRALFIFLLLVTGHAAAEGIDAKRAHFNYKLYCQGCHRPDGSGIESVPQIRGQVGHFLKTESGRDYLVRVPGAAGSTLKDKELAEVLNWMILEFGGDSVPEDFTPYSAEEVARLRDEPLLEVVEYRQRLVEQLARGEK